MHVNEGGKIRKIGIKLLVKRREISMVLVFE